MRIKDKTISGQLRAALRGSTQSIYRISKECGIDQGTLSRFRRGQVGLSLQNADRLAQYLGLKLIQN